MGPHIINVFSFKESTVNFNLHQCSFRELPIDFFNEVFSDSRFTNPDARLECSRLRLSTDGRWDVSSHRPSSMPCNRLFKKMLFAQSRQRSMPSMRFWSTAEAPNTGAFQTSDDALSMFNSNPGIDSKTVWCLAFTTQQVPSIRRKNNAIAARDFDQMSSRRSQQSFVSPSRVFEDVNEVVLALLSRNSTLFTAFLAA
jgi:hypothetical protein